MRFLATLLAWLTTTAALAVAVPAVWAQRTLVDADGYTALAQRAAADPELRQAAAAELTTQAVRLIRARGHVVDADDVHRIAVGYTDGPGFAAAFAGVNRLVHHRLFAGSDPDTDSWSVDLAPMLRDTVFQQILADYEVRLPETVVVRLTDSAPDRLRLGQLRRVAVWGPWLSDAAAGLTVICALLTLVSARRRGRALTWLGVSGLLVGAAGWAAIEIGRRYLTDALNQTTADIRRIADTLVDYAESSMHHWLDLVLAGGGMAVLLGAVVAVLGGLRG